LIEPKEDSMPEGTKQTEQMPPKVRGDGSAEPYAALLDSSQNTFSSWMQEAMALSQEVFRFVHERLEEDVAASLTFARCRSAEDVIDCQRRFATKAVEQYSAEIGKFSQIMVKLASVGLSFALAPATKNAAPWEDPRKEEGGAFLRPVIASRQPGEFAP
jgi:hypothetical protein